MKFLKEIIVVILLLIALLPAILSLYITLKLFSSFSPFLSQIKDELYVIHYTKQKLSEYQETLLKKVIETSFHVSMVFWICLIVYLTH